MDITKGDKVLYGTDPRKHGFGLTSANILTVVAIRNNRGVEMIDAKASTGKVFSYPASDFTKLDESRQLTEEKVECMECGKTFNAKVSAGAEPKCPKCGSYDVELAESVQFFIREVRTHNWHEAADHFKRLMEHKMSRAVAKERTTLMTEAKSWKVEVIADNSGKWCGNGMRYSSKDKAEAAAQSLASRWTLVRDWRVVESDDAINEAKGDKP